MRVAASAHGTVRIDMDSTERRLLTGLFTDTVDMLEGTHAHDVAEQGSHGRQDTAAAGPVESETRGLGEEFERMMAPGPSTPPDDAALRRLLPDVDTADAERSTEFRQFTEPDLRASKLANLRICLVTLDRAGRIELDTNEARAWLIALNDVRLVMATRMGIETDDDMTRLEATAEEASETVQLYLSVYDLLTWTQERLVGALAGE